MEASTDVIERQCQELNDQEIVRVASETADIMRRMAAISDKDLSAMKDLAPAFIEIKNQTMAVVREYAD